MTEINTVNEFKKSLRKERLSQEISQQELGRKVGVSKQTISAFELGNDGTSIDTILMICKELGIKLFIQSTI